MLKIFHRSSCGSSRKALSWMKGYEIPVINRSIDTVTFEELIQILSQTDTGIMEVLKHPSRINEERKYQLNQLFKNNFNGAVAYMVKHPEVLRSPIIISKNKYMIGFNIEEIRQFIPREYRKNLRTDYL